MPPVDELPQIKTPRAETSPSGGPPLPAGKPPRLLRFSLLSLLAVAAVACFAAAYYGVVRRHAAAERRAAELQATTAKQAEQIVALRAELGHLTIEDRTQVHLLELPTKGDREWKFRVYLPPGKKWRLCSSQGKIPAQGFEGVHHGWATLGEGEQTIEAFVHAPEGSEPVFVVRSPSGSSRGGIGKEDYQRLTNGGASWSSVGKSLQVKAPEEELVLLRYRTNLEVIAPDGSKSSRSTDEPTFGFLLWIEADES